MDINTYVEMSDRTCKHIPETGELISPAKYDLLHAALGTTGEAGELADAIKKHVFYNKPLDVANVREELGDLMWYIALMCRTIQCDPQDILDENIAKLQKRYPDAYTDFHASLRLDKE